MTEDQKRARLAELVAKEALEEIPKLMSDRAVRYFMKLPSHTDAAWGEHLERKPEYITRLWLGAIVQHLYNDMASQYEPEITTKLWKENKELIKRVQPFITEEMLDALSPWSHVMTHFKELFSPTKKYSIALNSLWFGEQREHGTAYSLIADTTVEESRHQSYAIWGMLRSLINENWPRTHASWEEKLGCGMPFFTLGLSGTVPPTNLCTEALNWHALGYYVHCEEPLDVNYTKTAKRLSDLKSEHVKLRCIVLEYVVGASPVLDGMHPYESSVLYRWALINGVQTRPTVYDAARALVPEYTVDWTNMEALGIPIEDAFEHVKIQAEVTTRFIVALPTSMDLS